MRQTEVSALCIEAGGSEAMREFARNAGTALAGFELDDLAKENLSLLFSLSAWLRFGRLGLRAACAALLDLRRALLDASGLDQSTEPVPLLAGEPKTALLSLAVYLHGLIGRSAARSAKAPLTVVEEALVRLQ